MARTHTETDFVPTDVNQLMAFRKYIIGGLRGQKVPEEDIDDKFQDIIIHCMASNFFPRVKEKVDAGLMTPRQFRSYLGTTIRNCLVNGWKKDNRDANTNAMSLSVPSDDSEPARGTVDLDRLQQTSNLSELSIPAEVVESDLIRYIAERKPAFLPTFILRTMGYRPADISRIIGKRKETIHYRVKSLHALITEYLAVTRDGAKPSKRKRTSTSVGPVYLVKGDNPFQRGSCYVLWDTLNAIGNPVTMREIVVITGRLMDQGKFASRRSPEEVAGTFVAVALEKEAIGETAAPNGNTRGGRAVQHAARTRYRFVGIPNPYKHWAGSHPIYDALVTRGTFDFNDLLTTVDALLDSGAIKSRRPADGIAWGFIETARGYKAIERAEENPVMPGDVVAAAVTRATVITGLAVNVPTPVRYAFCGASPYRRGINFSIWAALVALGTWTRDDVDAVTQQLIDAGTIKTRRPADQIGYQFYNNLKDYAGLYKEVDGDKPVAAPPVAAVDPASASYLLKGENPYRRGINHSIWVTLVTQGAWTEADVERIAAAVVASGMAKSRRPADQLSYQFLNTLRKWYPEQCVAAAAA